MQFVSDLIVNYNSLLMSIFTNNEFAVGAIAAGTLGFIVAFGKSLPAKFFELLHKHLTTSVTVESTTVTYEYLMKLLAERNVTTTVRNTRISYDGYTDIGFGVHYIWYDYTLLRISVAKETSPNGASRILSYVIITKLGRSHTVLNKLLSDANAVGIRPDRLRFFRQSSMWHQDTDYIGSEYKRPLSNVFIPAETKVSLLSTIDRFIASEAWYRNHSIPYQLTILLYGPPGTGKTSLIKAIASHLNRDIATATSAEAFSYLCGYDGKRLIVSEEIDLLGMSNRDSNAQTTDTDKHLSHILQALDGLITVPGRIVILSTNYLDRLDSALIRDGRIHLRLEVPYLSTETFYEMLQSFYPTFTPDYSRQVIPNLPGSAVQQFIMSNPSTDKLIDKFTTRTPHA